MYINHYHVQVWWYAVYYYRDGMIQKKVKDSTMELASTGQPIITQNR